MAFENSWRCIFCGTTTFFHAPSGDTIGLVVRLHFKYCRVMAPLVARAAQARKQARKLHFERKRHESNRKGRK